MGSGPNPLRHEPAVSKCDTILKKAIFLLISTQFVGIIDLTYDLLFPLTSVFLVVKGPGATGTRTIVHEHGANLTPQCSGSEWQDLPSSEG